VPSYMKKAKREKLTNGHLLDLPCFGLQYFRALRQHSLPNQ